MKKTIFLLAIAVASIAPAFSQKVALKLPKAQTFTIVPSKTIVIPARTMVADSITVIAFNEVPGASVSATILFSKTGDSEAYYSIPQRATIVLWSGSDYTRNQDWTNEMAFARIKSLFNIK